MKQFTGVDLFKRDLGHQPLHITTLPHGMQKFVADVGFHDQLLHQLKTFIDLGYVLQGKNDPSLEQPGTHGGRGGVEHLE